MKYIIPVTLLIWSILLAGGTTQVTAEEASQADVATPQAITLALFRWATVEVGETRDNEMLGSLIVPQAYGVAIREEDGKRFARFDALTDLYVIPEQKPSPRGWLETVLGMKVEESSSGANAWTSYEIRRTTDGPVIKKGVTNVQLFHDGARWWVLGWVDIDQTGEK